MHGQVIKYFHNKVEWFGSHLNGNVRAVNIRGTKMPAYYDFMHGWVMFHPCFDFIIEHLEVLEYQYERNSDKRRNP